MTGASGASGRRRAQEKHTQAPAAYLPARAALLFVGVVAAIGPLNRSLLLFVASMLIFTF